MRTSSLAAPWPMDLPAVMPAGLSGAGLLGAVSSLYGPILPDLTQEAAFGLLMVFHWTGFFLSTAGAQPAAALTCLHSTWGVGAVAAGLGWRAAGGLVMLTAGAASLLILRWGLIHLEPGAPVAWHGLPWRALALPLAMFVVYVGTETALGGWATTFFVGLGQGPVVGALAMAFFFLTFTVGRLSLAAFTDWLGVARTVQLGTGLGAASPGLTLLPGLACLGFGLSGLAYSVVFPTMLAWTARRCPPIRAPTASLSIAAAGLGGVFLPYLMGFGVERWGSVALPIMLIAALLTVFGASFLEPAPTAGRAQL